MPSGRCINDRSKLIKKLVDNKELKSQNLIIILKNIMN